MLTVSRVLAATSAAALLLAGCGASGADHPARHRPTTGHPAPSASSGPASTSSGTAAGATSGGTRAGATARPAVPRFAHVVVVVEENHASGEVIGNRAAPFMNAVARHGALLTRSYAVTHPSYPNYLALFSGSTHGIRNDSCPHYFSGANLGSQLRARHYSFAGYAESMPRTGYRGCTSGAFARRHAPWIDFRNLPRSLSHPMTAFPRNYAKLPRLAFVIPNLEHDMHDGTIAQADRWLQSRLSRYLAWARTHDSLLIVTWDEDDKSAGNHIPTLVAGAHVRTGHSATRVDHYRLLRTLEASFGLAALGAARHRSPITTIWK
jgi:acid phosphatase